MAVALVNHLVAPDDEAFAFDLIAELEKLIRLAERLAFGPSTQALLDEAAGRDIPYIRLDRYQPRPARPGRPPAADPGDDDEPRRPASPSTSRATRSSPTACSTRPACRCRAAEVVETEDDAVAAARRLGYPCVVKPLDGNHGRGVALDLRSEEDVRAAWPEALRQSRSRRRHRRDLHHRQRLPLPGHRRQARGGRGARPGQRHGRRRAHDPPARRHDERGPAPRHRPREGADEDQARRERPRSSSASRASTPDDVPPEPARFVKLALTGNMSHRRHVDRPDDGGPPRQHRDRRDGGPRRRPRHRRHRLHLPRHRDPRPRDRRRHRRGQRGARVPDAHPPDRGRAAVRRAARRSTCCSRPARRPASRSSP